MGSDFTEDQVLAMKKTEYISRILIKNESYSSIIWNLHLNCKTHHEIAKILKLDEYFDTSPELATNGVSNFIRGFTGYNGNKIDVEPFLSKKQVDKISAIRKEYFSNRNAQNKIGIYARDEKQIIEDSTFAGQNSAISRGQTPWIRFEDSIYMFSEPELLYGLTFYDEFQNGTGANLSKIMDVINFHFDNDRSYKSIKSMRGRINMNLEKFIGFDFDDRRKFIDNAVKDYYSIEKIDIKF